MHELAITQSVVDAVLEKLPEERVTRVSLTIGMLSGIEPDAVRFCFELVTAGTGLQGADLEIARPVGRAHCRRCDTDFTLDTLILLCGCGSADVHVESGQELSIRSVQVA